MAQFNEATCTKSSIEIEVLVVNEQAKKLEAVLEGLRVLDSGVFSIDPETLELVVHERHMEEPIWLMDYPTPEIPKGWLNESSRFTGQSGQPEAMLDSETLSAAMLQYTIDEGLKFAIPEVWCEREYDDENPDTGIEFEPDGWLFLTRPLDS